MSQDLFRVGSKGIAIGTSIHILYGTTAPSGADADAAPVGSEWTDTITGYQYTKDTAGTGTDKWVKLATQADIDAAVSGSSWRDPALVRDNTAYLNIAGAVAAANIANTVDGIVISAGSRLLITNLTTGNENVYIVSGSTGNWTFTEDTRAATEGDLISILQGTSGGTQYRYDGSAWVLANQPDLDEIGYVHTFVGKTAFGSETPTYSSQVFVTNGDNLETAIGILDSSLNTTNTNIGDITSYSSTLIIANNDSLVTAVGKLDQELGNLTKLDFAQFTIDGNGDLILTYYGLANENDFNINAQGELLITV